MSNAVELPIKPNPKFLDGVTPTITWNGDKWPVPLLAPRQNRHVIPALMRTFKNFALLADIRNAPPLTEDQYEDISSIVFWGLKRAHPDLTREQFDDVPLSMIEMMENVKVVSEATGIVKKATQGDGSTASVGEDQQVRQTGT